MHEIESPFPIMFPLILYIHTVNIIVTRFTLSYIRKKKQKTKKEQPPQAVLSCAILLLVIVILTAMTNAVES